MAATPFSLEGLFAYISETFAAGVIQSYQGQGLLDDAPLLQRQDPLEDFNNFNRNDQVFQEYDPPSGDDKIKRDGKDLARQHGDCRYGRP